MNLTSKMRKRQSPFGYEDDKLWLLTQDELQAASHLGVPVETIMGKRTLYRGDALQEDTRTIKFYDDDTEIAVTAYGVRESVISAMSPSEDKENAGMILRSALEFASMLADEHDSVRGWDIMPEDNSSVVIDLEQSRDIAQCGNHRTAQTIAMMKSALPFVVESLRRALIDYYEHQTEVSDQMIALAKSIVSVKQNTDGVR